VAGKEPLSEFKNLPKVGKADKWDGLDHKPSYEESDLWGK